MNALIPTQVADASLPEVYTSARQALAQCASVDECKDWSDRAAALASYAKQANDDELETKARTIRNRAIRRMGEVLAQIEPQQGKRTDQPKAGDHPKLTRNQAAVQAGISDHQRKTALRVAAVPDDEYDAAHDNAAPTLSELAERGTKKRVVIDHTGGRDPTIFNKAMHFVGDLTRAAKSLQGRNEILRHLTPQELAEAQSAAEILREISEEIEAY